MYIAECFVWVSGNSLRKFFILYRPLLKYIRWHMTIALKVRVLLKRTNKILPQTVEEHREVVCIDGDSGRRSGLERTVYAIPDLLITTFVNPLEEKESGYRTGRCSELFKTQLGRYKYLILVCHSLARNTDAMPLSTFGMIF